MSEGRRIIAVPLPFSAKHPHGKIPAL